MVVFWSGSQGDSGSGRVGDAATKQKRPRRGTILISDGVFVNSYEMWLRISLRRCNLKIEWRECAIVSRLNEDRGIEW